MVLNDNFFKKGTFAIFAFFLVLYPALSFDYGVTGDELVHVLQAKKVLSYYTAGFEDVAKSIDKTKNHYLYGQSFDNFCELVHRILPFTELFNLRHAMGAIFGVIGMFFTALVVRAVGAGWLGAFITMVFFGFAAPRYTGHMINNLKDAPFAVAYIINIYAMIRFFREMPNPSKKTSVFLLLSLALPLSIRTGGLLNFAYLGLFAAVDIIMKTGLKNIGSSLFFDNVKTYSKYLLPILVLAYFLGLIFWPYALQDPFSAPLESLSEFSNFSTSLPQIFEGEMIASDDLPWYYLIKYIGITMPLVTLLGIILFFPLAWKNKDKWNSYVLFIVLFSIVFPIVYIIYKKANVYGGWRHVLFVGPPLVALSALGWTALLNTFSNKMIKIAGIGCFLILSFLPIKYLIANHPYGVVYFNEFVGGVEGAYGDYEMDYYGTSLKSCVKWLEENENIFTRTEPLLMRTNAEKNLRYIRGIQGKNRFLADKEIVQLEYSRYNQRSEKAWDIAIWQNMYISPDQLRNGTYPSEDILYTAGVGKAIFAAVVRRPSYEDLKGFEALKASKKQEAIAHFNNYIKVNQKNETVYSALANTYFELNAFDKAAKAAGSTIQLDNSQLNAYNIAGLSYLNLKDYNNAINAFGSLVRKHPNPNAYYYLAICYANLNDNNTALTFVNNALQLNPNFKEAIQLKQQLSGVR